MTKDKNKNIIITALLALVVFGMAAGTASAATNITITNDSYASMEYGVGIDISAIADGSTNISLELNTTNATASGQWYVNITNTSQIVSIYNGTAYLGNTTTNNTVYLGDSSTNITINLSSTSRIPFFTLEVIRFDNATEKAVSTNLSFVPANSTGGVDLNDTTYSSGETANVTVVDADMNLNSSANDTLSVNITSDTNSTNLTLTLTETDVNTNIFSAGVFDFSATGDANTLVVSDGDTIYAKYTDHDSSVTSDTATFDAVASKLVINSTIYGNLTTQHGVATTPGTMVAGVATVFKINATDASNVLDTGFTGTMTISVNSSGAPNVTSYTFQTSDNGTKEISVTDNVAETINVSFNRSSFTNDTTTEIVVPNKPAKLMFNSSMPLSTLTTSLQVNISVTDAHDNPINTSKLNSVANTVTANGTQLGGTDGLGLGVAFNVQLGLPTAGSSSLDRTTILMNNTTVNTYQAYLNDTVDETVVLRASSNFFDAIQTSITFLPAVSYILLDTNKTDDTANANGGANGLGIFNITAQLMSADGVALNVQGTVITFNSMNTSVMDILGVTAITNANGIATTTNSTTTTAGTAVIEANDASGHVGKDASGNIGLTVTTTPVVDNASSTLLVASAARAGDNVTVYATLKDYGGSLVVGETVTFNITSGDSASTLNSVAKGTLVTAVTNSTGVATVTFRGTNGTMPGIAHSINATVVDELDITRRVGPAEDSITLTPNDASVLVVSPASKGLANLLGESATFNVTTYDSYGNINTSIGNVKINVSTTDTSLGNMTVGATIVNNYAVITTNNGFGQLTYKVNTTTPGSTTLTFGAYTYESGQISALNSNITKDVPVTTSGASIVTITPSAESAAVGTNVTLTVNLTDESGNLIGIDGTNMSLITTGGTLNATSTTSTDGQAFVNLTSSTPGSITVTVYVAGLTSDSTTVLFSGNATTFTVTPSSSPVNVDETINLTIQAYDELGNKAAIYNGVAITSETGVIPAVTGLTFGAHSFTFNATGYAMVNVTSATAGAYTVNVVALGMLKTADVEFVDISLPNLSVSASPESVIVGTATDVTFTVTSGGTAVSGATVTLSGAGVSESGTTDNGTATISVNATSAGTIDVTVTKTGYNTAITSVTAEPVVTELHVVINEFIGQQWGGTGLDQIELYNPTDSEVNLTGWTLVAHDPESTTAILLLDGETIAADGYLVYECITEGPFTISQSEDILILKNGGVEVDRVAWGDYDDGDLTDNAPAPGLENSTGRSPNGVDTDVDSDDFIVFTTPTIGTSNTPLLTMTVTATPDTINVSEPTDITINVTDSTGAPIDGASVTLKFNSSVIASGTTVGGEYTAVGVNVTEAGEIDVTVTATGYNPGSATVTVGEAGLPKTGDIDGSGEDPTMTDAVYLAKHVVVLSGYETIYADGDIDSSGEITMTDAVYLAKHVVGLSGYEILYP